VRESSVGVSKEVLQNEALKMLRGEQDKEGAGKADRSGPSRVGAGARGGKEGGKEAGALDEFCVDLTAQVRFRVLLRCPAALKKLQSIFPSLWSLSLRRACVCDVKEASTMHRVDTLGLPV